MSYTVYKHIAPNNKVYIGITSKKPNLRWRNGKGYINNKYFTIAINKYGWNAFEHIILYENLSKEEAEAKEIELIKKYKSNQREFGYNIENGGNSSGKLSNETKNKLSIAHKGKVFSEEHKKQLSEAHKGHGHGGFAQGRIVSKEVKLKIAEKHYIPIICIQTGEVFKSIVEASKVMNLSKSGVCMTLKGKRKQIKGYNFAYMREVVNL